MCNVHCMYRYAMPTSVHSTLLTALYLRAYLPVDFTSACLRVTLTASRPEPRRKLTFVGGPQRTNVQSATT